MDTHAPTQPVIPVVTSVTVQAQGQLEHDQVIALKQALAAANVITLPNGATFESVQSLNFSVMPTGAAKFTVGMKS